MRIDFVMMKNFRQYQEAKIEFSQLASKAFTVILGVNGAGKTNLLNAVTWCLFGEELHADSKYPGLPILNTTTMLESEDEPFEIRVEIGFTHTDGNKTIVTRSIHYRKDTEGSLTELPNPNSLEVMQQRGRDWIGPILGKDAQFLINNWIPPTIEEYFFFDGERMDDYFRENTGKDIKTAVFKISQLELFEKLIEHLNTRRNDYLKAAGGLSSKAQEIRESMEIQIRSLDTDQTVLKELVIGRDEATRLENDFTEKLKNSSSDRIKELEEQRENLQNDIKNLSDQIRNIENDKLKMLHKNMPIIFSYEALQKTKSLIDGRSESGQIPPLYRRIFIDDLLKKERCICGSDISKRDEYSSARRKKVESYLMAGRLSELSNELIESNTLIRKMIEDIVDFPKTTIELSRRLRSLQRSLTDKNQDFDRIEQDLKQINIENIKLWTVERKKYSNEKNRLIGDIAKQENQIEIRKRWIRVYRSNLNKELGKEEKHKALLKVLAFCDEGIECARDVRDTVMEKVREEIEEKTSKQFLELIWKKDTYKGVRIDDEYNISVHHVSGMDGFGTLSAGERQVCALSFVAALNSVSGFEAPLIIDTPLARISSEPSRNIARDLPKYLKDKQVTLLVLEKEYTPEVRNELSESVGRTYVIEVEEKEHGNLAKVRLT